MECKDIITAQKLNAAIALMNAGKYEEAITAFKNIDGNYNNYITECSTKLDEIAEQERLQASYDEAVAFMNEGKYEDAIGILTGLGDFKDSADKIAQCETAILDAQYTDAIALLDAGNVTEAYPALIALNGHKDSAEKADSIFEQYKKEILKNAQPGDYVYLGSYEQDNDAANGSEAIVWLVLDVKDGKALLISKYTLDNVPFYNTYTQVTWKNSHLRGWLIDTFWNAAFTPEEQAAICVTKVTADKNPDYKVNSGYATEDKIFLLSAPEVTTYFSGNNARACAATPYALANGAQEDYDYAYWWLRTPGKNLNFASFINSSGRLNTTGKAVNTEGMGIRPALWVELEF